MKAHHREELASGDCERTRPARSGARPDQPARIAFGRPLLASWTRTSWGRWSARQPTALKQNGKAPLVPRERLLVALAEVQLDALAAMKGRDEGRVRPVEPTSPPLTQPEPGNDDTSWVPLGQFFKDYIAVRQAVNRHKDGGKGGKARSST